MECISNKICYATRQDAQAHITHLCKEKSGSYKRYKCKECGSWHIFTVPKNKKKMRPLKEKNYSPREVKNPVDATAQLPPIIGRSVVKKSVQTTYKPFEKLKLGTK